MTDRQTIEKRPDGRTKISERTRDLLYVAFFSGALYSASILGLVGGINGSTSDLIMGLIGLIIIVIAAPSWSKVMRDILDEEDRLESAYFDESEGSQ